MNAHTIENNTQKLQLNGADFALMPYDDYLMMKKELEHLELSQSNDITFPHEVIGLELKYNNIIKAWRIYLKKNQKDVATTAGISAAALSQIEKPGSTPQQATIKKLAKAMAISPEQLISVD